MTDNGRVTTREFYDELKEVRKEIAALTVSIEAHIAESCVRVADNANNSETAVLAMAIINDRVDELEKAEKKTVAIATIIASTVTTIGIIIGQLISG